MEERLVSYDPASGAPIGDVAVTPVDAVAERVAASRAALSEWRARPIDERVEIVARAAAEIGPRGEELARLLSREMGKDLGRAMGEVRSCASDAPYKGRLVADALAPRTIGGPGGTRISYRPLGVCAVITPWNYPMMMAHWMIVPALVAGNTVVLKPSEETPLIAQAYVDALTGVLPENVLQVVHGGDAVGKALVAADVNLVAFTGSREAGKHIMASAAGGLKRLIMELGGNDPLIVLGDADLDRAAHFAVANSFENAGQMCIATERVFVDAAVADAFEEKVAAIASRYRVGAWDDPGADIGPIINGRQRDHIIAHIDAALAEGARALVGGAAHPDRFVSPTVLADVTDDMRVAMEETFGPVVCITRFDDIDAAVASANASPYGLGAVVFGGAGAEAVAERLEAGMIGINGGVGGGGDSPWVGAKESGYGFHGSPEGHRQFAQVRVTNLG